MRIPWTARRSNQSILKEISPGCSSEGLMFKLKLQYFCHLMRRTDSLEKILMLRKIEARGEGDRYLFQYSCLQNPMDRGAWWATVHGSKSETTYQLNNNKLERQVINMFRSILRTSSDHAAHISGGKAMLFQKFLEESNLSCPKTLRLTHI